MVRTVQRHGWRQHSCFGHQLGISRLVGALFCGLIMFNYILYIVFWCKSVPPCLPFDEDRIDELEKRVAHAAQEKSDLDPCLKRFCHRVYAKHIDHIVVPCNVDVVVRCAGHICTVQ